MGKQGFKKLDMSCENDKKILLTYFFKDFDTVINKDELLTISCIHYDTQEKNLHSCTKRFEKELLPFKDKKISSENVDSTIINVLDNCLKIHEELVRCDLIVDNSIEHFYIAVIGIEFFQVENEVRE